jgi:predicted enzyme related to lactoylglutathione lyase
MLPRVDSVVFDCADPAVLAGFWAALLGLEAAAVSDAWCELERTDSGIRLGFQTVPEPKPAKNRVHLDLYVDDLDRAADRAVELGAVRHGVIVVEEADADGVTRFQVMRDPEGNEFCFIAR